MQNKATIPVQFLGTLIVTLCLSGQVQGQDAQDKIQTDRPDQTESSSLVPGSTVQFELGYQFQKNTTDGFEAKTHAYPAALVRIGALDWLELRLQGALKDSVLENGSRRKVRGYGPISVGTKVKLWEEQGWRPEAALLLMVALPVASLAFRPDNPEPQARLALSNKLTEQVELAYNLVYSHTAGDDVGGYSVSLSGELHEKLTAFAEVFGSKAASQQAEHQADAGLMFFPRNNLQLNVAAGTRLNKAAPDYFLTAGLAIRLPG